MESKRVYPDDLNPFGSGDEESESVQQADSTNPFGSDDEEEYLPTKTTVSVTPVSPSDPVQSFAQLRLEDKRPGASDRRSSDGFALKPPLAPRRVSATDVSEDRGLSQNSPLTIRSAVVGAGSSMSGDSRPTSTTPSPVPRVKRRAPVPPVAAGMVSPSPSADDVGKVEESTKKPAPRKSKKPAPPPPSRIPVPANNFEQSSAIEAQDDAVVPVVTESGDALQNGSPSLAKRHSLFKNPDDRDFPHELDGPAVVDDVEDPKILEQMRELVAEHRLIEAELRQLLEIPPERKTESHTAREEQLIKDLVDNVKRREELEYEVEDCEHDATTGAKIVKKMKKKRRFKLKKLLGVSS